MEIKIFKGKDFYKAVSYKSENLKLWIVIHSTKLGPALGGCRMLKVDNSFSALKHVALLSKAMTYKNAVVDLPFGGGKTLIYDWNPNVPRETLLLEFSNLLNSLKGEYMTADDVNTSVKDMEFMRNYTPYARGVYYKGTQIPATSYGVCMAIKAAAKEVLHTDSLDNINIFIQGLGKVGYNFAKMLRAENANVYVYDINKDIMNKCIEELDCIPSDPNGMFSNKIDILSPCALGNTINDDTVHMFKAKVIAGGANNQLQSRKLDNVLFDRGITYIPDFLCNSGGVIDVDCEGINYCPDYVYKRVGIIYDKSTDFLKKAKENKTSVLTVAEDYVLNKLK
ncbi:MAG: leucine dehydrogenase [Alphaproteobacteria bacterium]|nr:leucine dehydrogenase [Alphaproteobacteria bacterium]